jgi:hypothetical protein
LQLENARGEIGLKGRPAVVVPDRFYSTRDTELYPDTQGHRDENETPAALDGSVKRRIRAVVEPKPPSFNIDVYDERGE